MGKHKAVFFRSIGFNEGNIDLLTKCLLDIVHTNDILNKVVNQFGINYKVDGSFQAPNGSIIRLTTAWTVDAGKRAPRLVSAYPV